MTDLLDILKEQLGKKVVLQGNDIGVKYHADWSGEPAHKPLAILRPGNTDELSLILKTCNDANQAVVVQGGMTGLAGGATPQTDEVGVSLERMSGIDEIDTDTMTLTALAGTPLQIVQDAAEGAGFIFPMDLGARGSCNIGGNISTNAGGNQVIRYGMTRSLVLGLEVVLADGTVINSMNKLLKNNAGYDLKQLFIGSEGTLGVVTRVVLRLFPKPKSTCTALCALNNFADAIKLLQLCTDEFSSTLDSYEVMWANYYDFVVEHVNSAQSPFDKAQRIYVLLETRGADQNYDSERFEHVLADAMEHGMIQDAVIAQSQKEKENFWSIRDGIGEILPRLQPTTNFDIGIPISKVQQFLDQLETELRQSFSNLTTLTFGHIGDGNIHYLATTGNAADKESIYNIVYRTIGQFQGSVSAEHGIGVQKRQYLGYSRNPEEIQLMRHLKQSMDPKGILNNNRII